jgi:hypothetical protein
MWRKIEMRGDQTLEQLHLAIQDAFEFDNDHLYSFFMSGKAWDKKTEYSLPEGETPYGEFFVGERAEDEFDEKFPETLDPDAFLREEVNQMTDDAQEREQLFALIKTLLMVDEKELPAMIHQFAQASGQPEPIVQMHIQLMRSMFEDIMIETQRDVRKVTIDELNLRARKKFMYLFDYGDEWRFSVQVNKINKNAPEDVEYPRIVESAGKPPPQYPNWDEEDDDWGEEDDDGGFIIYGDADL